MSTIASFPGNSRNSLATSAWQLPPGKLPPGNFCEFKLYTDVAYLNHSNSEVLVILPSAEIVPFLLVEAAV